MREEKQTINGFETTVLVGDEADVSTPSESAASPEKKADKSSTETKARKSADNKAS